MIESGLEAEKTEEVGLECIQTINRDSGHGREPSFSGWCDEDGRVHLNCQLENSDANSEDSEFELPLVQRGELKAGQLDRDGFPYIKFHIGSMHLNNDNSRIDVSIDREGNSNHVPFEIEDGHLRERNFSSFGVNESSPIDNDRVLEPNLRSSVSVASILKMLVFILLWYTFSTLLTLYNKSLLGDQLGKFPAPLLMNTFHFTMQAILSKAITWFWSNRFEPCSYMSWRDFSLKVVPTALGTALDINLSNASLVFISVTFATMCKSAAPIFLLLFAFAFRLESPSLKLMGIILVISVGILLTVAKETEFEFWGFSFVMLAAVMSGFRWSMTQILLQKESYGLKDPITFMSYVAPVMAIATAIMSLAFDPWHEFKKDSYFDGSWHIMRSCFLMLFGGILAFFMVLMEYILVSVTSAVTVTIAGVVKEAVTILVAVFYFHDEFTWLKGAGLFTIMFGVSLFNWYKYQKLHNNPRGEDRRVGSPTINSTARYVILEELMDDNDDAT